MGTYGLHRCASNAQGGGASSSPAPELPPDDVIREIFLRLPLHPACLHRVSRVCKRWRGLVRDPSFLRRFLARHHHAAPLLGFFHDRHEGFASVGDPPNSVDADYFSRMRVYYRYRILGSRHGLVLFRSSGIVWFGTEEIEIHLLVWDPMTGRSRQVPMHPRHRRSVSFNADVVCCSASGGLRSKGQLRPFRVIFFFADGRRNRLRAGVYSSETAAWSNLVSMSWTCWIALSQRASWVKYGDVHLDELLRTLPSYLLHPGLANFILSALDEDENTVFFSTTTNCIFALQLNSMEVREVLHAGSVPVDVVSYTSFYDAGDTDSTGEDAGANEGTGQQQA